jgi:hypothetical protein
MVIDGDREGHEPRGRLSTRQRRSPTRGHSTVRIPASSRRPPDAWIVALIGIAGRLSQSTTVEPGPGSGRQ